MAARIILGAQWGDEGKGKIVDLLSADADYVVRYQGGSNAGHTVVTGSETFILHLVPSGILHPGKICVLGNGVVIDPVTFLAEIEGLEKRGIDTAGRVLLSERAHVIFPFHKTVEAFEEDRGGGEESFGTTRRGIGPAYRDKAGRTGIRVVDLYDPDRLRARIAANVEWAGHWMTRDGGGRPDLDPDALTTTYLEHAERLRPLVANTSHVLYRALREGRSVLLEGAQGTLLDLDQGTYPFVTSSSATAGGALTGTGIGPGWIEEVIGVAKAYTTRVGRGPFPTEMPAELGARLRDQGAEFGATTGRPRRCGWLDGVGLRHAVRVNGLSGLAITKVDVLSGLDTLRIATGYNAGGAWITEFPADPGVLESCIPVYEEHPGWTEDLSSCRSWTDLPANARSYLERIAEIMDVPIRWISVGSSRDATISL
jgi:adenylosuccinate synthase